MKKENKKTYCNLIKVVKTTQPIRGSSIWIKSQKHTYPFSKHCEGLGYGRKNTPGIKELEGCKIIQVVEAETEANAARNPREIQATVKARDGSVRDEG